MSNPHRCGKIARLPKTIREEINQRLDRGATAKSLVPWLNGLPEVQALVKAEFDGHPVSEHNLSQWKKGGYEEWLRYQEAVAFADHLHERAQEMKTLEKDRMPMSQVFTLWLTARMAVSTRQIERLKGDAAWKKQRQFCTDLMKIRRAEQQAEQMQIARERTELQRQKLQFQCEQAELKRAEKERRRNAAQANTETKAAPEAMAENVHPWKDWTDEAKIAWARRPENLQRIHPPLTDEQPIARLGKVFGVPDSARAAA